jgi:hypothetical protein
VKTKLTIDNLDHSHSVTFEKMVDAKIAFEGFVPPLSPFSSSISEPTLFSHLDQLFGIQSFFRAFSRFTFPRAFARIRFLFTSRMIARICPLACIECIQDVMLLTPEKEKEGEILLECFQEIEEKETLLKQITLRIRSHQRS